MGYYIRLCPEKKSEPKWKVQFVSHKKERTKGSSAKNPKKTWNVSRERWAGLGFRGSMTVDQARARQRQLNSQLELKRQEEKCHQIEKEQEKFNRKCFAFLPEIYMDEFEKKYLLGRFREQLLYYLYLCDIQQNP